mmetsp:Transcript_8733/g.19494  ORF Transcript_8733/g.19494 Transcript_8733/m.19494 type:complete len:204 (-) Transcript_8733:47-658(-)
MTDSKWIFASPTAWVVREHREKFTMEDAQGQVVAEVKRLRGLHIHEPKTCKDVATGAEIFTTRVFGDQNPKAYIQKNGETLATVAGNWYDNPVHWRVWQGMADFQTFSGLNMIDGMKSGNATLYDVECQARCCGGIVDREWNITNAQEIEVATTEPILPDHASGALRQGSNTVYSLDCQPGVNVSFMWALIVAIDDMIEEHAD